MFNDSPKWRLYRFCRKRKLHSAKGSAVSSGMLVGLLLGASTGAGFFLSPGPSHRLFPSAMWAAMWARQTEPATPVVVQPGAPGKPSRTLPPSTRATLPPRSHADVEFMQGMIMHHSQAVEMTALMASHTENKDLRSLGARISSSQSDEIKFMQRWLAARGEPVDMPMKGPMQGATSAATTRTPDMDMSSHTSGHTSDHTSRGMSRHGSPQQGPLMPGMLTPEQMEALRKAKGAEFDHLFLTGMIQHHNGALTMVKDLFDTAGAGQDADVFNFATDADNTQRAEIRIMQSMLENLFEKRPSEEKR
jgi:uncharacterized protein (DUF305 family)